MPVDLYAPKASTIIDVVRGLAMRRMRGPTEEERDIQRLSAPAQSILKAATGSATLANVQWAGALAQMAQASQEFLARLDGRSAIVALLDMNIIGRAPAYVPLITIGAGASASLVAEGAPRPISKLSLGLTKLEPLKIQSTVVLSKELLSEAPQAQAFLARMLKLAVAQAIDAALIGQLTTGVTPISAGTGQAADIGKLLGAVNTTGMARLAWVSAPDVANRLTISNPLGSTSPTGVSEAYGLPLFVSSGMAPGSLALIDGDRVAGDVSGFGVEVATDTSLNMNDAPTLPNSATGAGTTLVSLWMTNSVAVGVTAVGDIVAATGAVALMTGIAWTGA